LCANCAHAVASTGDGDALPSVRDRHHNLQRTDGSFLPKPHSSPIGPRSQHLRSSGSHPTGRRPRLDRELGVSSFDDFKVAITINAFEPMNEPFTGNASSSGEGLIFLRLLVDVDGGARPAAHSGVMTKLHDPLKAAGGWLLKELRGFALVSK